jgi:hypothetical protein
LIRSGFIAIDCAMHKGSPLMLQRLNIETHAQMIEQPAARAGRALADYLAQQLGEGLMEPEFEQHRIAEFIFGRTAADVIQRFNWLLASDEAILRSRVIEIVKSAFKERLAELNNSEV